MSAKVYRESYQEEENENMRLGERWESRCVIRKDKLTARSGITEVVGQEQEVIDWKSLP
jgi:hypothetical protein